MRHQSMILVALMLGFSVPSQGVAGPSVSTQTAPGASFGTYRTYSWVTTMPPQNMNPIIYQEIIADIDAALAEKGYRKADVSDLSLIVSVGAHDKTEIQTWGRFGLRTDVWQYTEGQLSLDAFETNTKKAVWHGQATGTINPAKPKPAKIDAAVRKLMDRFPTSGATSP